MMEKKLSLLIVLICLITLKYPVHVTVLSNGDELPDLPSNYVEIEEKDYFVMNQSFEEGKKMEVNIEALPESLPLVDIYILYEDNFTSYKSNESFVFIKNLSYERVKGGFEALHLTGNLSEHGKYFFVIDNTYRGKAKPNNILPTQYSKTAGVYYEISFDIYKDSDDDGHYDREDAYPDDPDRWEEDGISNISFLTTLTLALVVSVLYKRKKFEG